MGWRKAFFPILLGLILVGFIFGRGFEARRATLGANFSKELESLLVRQDAERKIEVVELKPSLKLESSEAMPLFGPLELEVGSAGELFVFDSGDLKIKVFSADGRPLRTLGRGKGQGPGEFLSATDFTIDSAGTLWVVDLHNGRLSGFRADGTETTIKLAVQPYRLAFQPDGSFFAMFGLIHDRLFGRFDAAGAEQQRFGQWLEDQGLNSMLLDGFIDSTGSGFVYVGRYSGLLANFGANGQPIFVTETVDGAGLPRILQGDGGRHWVDREAGETARALMVCQGEAVVFTSIESGLVRQGVLDRYDLEGGRYLGTWRTNTPAMTVQCTDNAFYTIGERSIERWSLPPKS